MAVVEVNNIRKSYDDFVAVDGVSFSIEEGTMFGLLGPNGAGKTTTMRMLMNIIVPDSGEILLFGEHFSETHKNLVGYLPEERGLYPRMKLLDQLQFMAELKGMPATRARQEAADWLKRFDLYEFADKKIQELSKGMQQKAQFIGTILHRPRLVIMDEPFSGLDPINAKFLKDILLELKNQGMTIILSTHLMDQAEKLCEQICLVNKGKAVLKGKLSEIKQRFSRNMVLLEYEGEGSRIAHLPGVEQVNDYGNYMEVRLAEGCKPQQFLRALVEDGIEVRRFETTETPLEEIFIQIVGGGHHE
ncbi:MAG: ATP-binding cassette domain-containing protein [Calditrichaeota bacterium]|nr:MAG: ATP-binding cassette domain-containing protein [Calditrichota bacterium]